MVRCILWDTLTFQPHHVGHFYAILTWGYYCVLDHYFANVIPGHCCTALFSGNDFLHYCDLRFHCCISGNSWIPLLCNNAFQQWYFRRWLSPWILCYVILLKLIYVEPLDTVFRRTHRTPCCENLKSHSGTSGYILLQNMTMNMDGPIRCSLLTLEWRTLEKP